VWAVGLFDRESPFVARDGRKFLKFLEKVRQHRANASIRGAILCHNRASYQERGLMPFPTKRQRKLLKIGVVLLSFDGGDYQ
jgi:hypothetical protein